MDLALVLQRLYDSEINVTITWVWDGGIDFALISYMSWEEAGRPIDRLEPLASTGEVARQPVSGPDPWHGVNDVSELAQAFHDAAVAKYPESTYAKLYGRVN